jgi:hypothetical protein
MAKNRNTNSTQDISFKERLSALKIYLISLSWCGEVAQVKHSLVFIKNFALGNASRAAVCW